MAKEAVSTVSQVVSTSPHPVCTGEGSFLATGDTLEIDMDHPVNRDLLLDHHITVIGGFTPRVRHEDPDADTNTEIS